MWNYLGPVWIKKIANKCKFAFFFCQMDPNMWPKKVQMANERAKKMLLNGPKDSKCLSPTPLDAALIKHK